jgi:hypothetical protein
MGKTVRAPCGRNKFKPNVTAKQVTALPHPTTIMGMPF